RLGPSKISKLAGNRDVLCQAASEQDDSPSPSFSDFAERDQALDVARKQGDKNALAAVADHLIQDRFNIGFRAGIGVVVDVGAVAQQQVNSSLPKSQQGIFICALAITGLRIKVEIAGMQYTTRRRVHG